MLVTACPNGNLYNAKRHKFYLLSENFSLPQDVFTFMYACVIQTRKSASWLAEKMTADGHSVALLSGEMTVEQRLAVLNRFRDSKEKVLITTNVSARGIDVEQVSSHWPP